MGRSFEDAAHAALIARSLGNLCFSCYNRYVEIRLLGPLEVQDGGTPLVLPRRQQRALLAALALRAGEVVSTDRLVADLWGESAPASATGSLQNTVSALRKLLGRDVLVTQAPGYRLAVDADSVDANRFERLLEAARTAEPAARAQLLREALALWRGPALADLDEEDFARLEAARLDELRVTAHEERVDAELELGRHAALVGELETLVATHPLRERLRGQLMLTLYRCGRQAEALEVYRAARLALADELGLDPSPELQELERRVLRQDPSLARPVPPPADIAPVSAERRLVSVLVAVPPAEDDPETLRRRLDDVLASARDTLTRYGGELERFGPEGLVAVFGAEAPRDDDAIRAVAAAEGLGLRAGVATGETVAGAGAVFVRAAELARGPGVQLDERTHALVHAVRRLHAPLAGRGEELARLTGELAAARQQGRCRVLTVLGEPGIGKSRLARELVLRAGGETEILIARCLSYGEGATFLPLLSALRRVEPEAVLADEPDGSLVLERLAALAGGTDAASIGESYWAVRRLLETLAARRPVLLVLDDVHWAEPALLDLVDYLADRTAVPLLVLCLARPELERVLGETLRLGPLADDHARLVVQATAELEEQTQERIVGLAEGNALYVEQLAAYAAESGEGLPPTLEAVLAGRLGQLEADERTVLQRGAVVGREFTRGAVAALVEEPVDAQLASLGRRGLIRAAPDAEPGDDAYRFHHVLLRDAAYATLTKRDRADLHERTAAWLDRDEPGDDALVGYHLEQATLLQRDLGEDADALAAAAGERLGGAGMRAWRQTDARAAAGLLGRACALLPAGRLRGALRLELAIALRFTGERTAAIETYKRAGQDAAQAQAPALSLRIELERLWIDLYDGRTTPKKFRAHAARTLAALESEHDDRGLGRTWLALAGADGLACQAAAWGAAAARAAEHYEKAGWPASTCVGYQAEALFYGATRARDAIRQCNALLANARDRSARAYVVAVLGALLAMDERVPEARALAQESAALFEEAGMTTALRTVLDPLRMVIERLAGENEAAERIARASCEGLASLGPAYRGTRAAQLADLLCDRGAIGEAAEWLAVARRDATPHDVLATFLRLAVEGRVLAARDRGEEALALVENAAALAVPTDALNDRARVELARAHVHGLLGDRSSADRAVREAERLYRAKGNRAALAALPARDLATTYKRG